MKALIDGDIYNTHINAAGYEVVSTTPHEYIHRLVAEKALGRKLKGTEQVHHVDGNKRNNKNNNLVICPNMGYHKLLHAKQRIIALGGHPTTHNYCSYHKEIHFKEEFSTRPSHWSGLHNMCRSATNEYRKLNGYNLRKNRKS